ncbi:AdoMet-dependent rRNA methyltransferase SPB1, partial [Phenoliferia sp. Uapishka_3]
SSLAGPVCLWRKASVAESAEDRSREREASNRSEKRKSKGASILRQRDQTANFLHSIHHSVLHDGAPNVGSAWVQDAFTQVELVLSSLKLATEFLAPGGTFVTKVFRSKDYNSLLWVFNQLFQKVEATKPPSSRNVSAEIFVVCTGYLAPQRIDPKLLSAKFVFSDVDAVTPNALNPLTATIETKDTLTPATLNVFAPEKKRRQRDGYDEGDLLLYKECGVMEFIRSVDPIGVLGMVGRMRWLTAEDKKLFKNPLTSADVKASVEDLKVLGKKDFKILLKYRIAIREDLGIDSKATDVEDLIEKAEIEPLDEEEQIEEELTRLSTEDALRRRRERRRLNERKTRDVQRMQLNMVTPMDVGLERQDGIDDSDMFDLGEVEGGVERRGIPGGLGSDIDEGDDESGESGDDEEEEESDGDEDEDEKEKRTKRLENNLDALYDQYQQHKSERDAKHKAKEERRKRDAAEGGEWHGIKQDSESESEGDQDPAPMPSDDDDSSDEDELTTSKKLAKAATGMDVDDGEGMDVDDDEDEDDEEKAPTPALSKRAIKAAALAESKKRARDGKLITKLPATAKPTADKSRQAAMWFDQPVFKGLKGLKEMMEGDAPEEEDVDSDAEVEREWAEMNEDEEKAEAEALAAFEEEDDDEDSDDDFTGAREVHEDDPDMAEEADFKAQEEAEELKRQRIEELGLTTGEAMTLAQQLVNRERTKTQMIDEGFNRMTDLNGGDGLPSWFLDDESKHFRNNIPVTKEAVAAIREKLRELNARPIKKIAEAKARKKMRTIRRIEKTRQKAQGINDDDENGLTEKDKASAIAKVLSKSASSASKPVKKEIKLVVARGLNRGNKGRPNGVKGRYKKSESAVASGSASMAVGASGSGSSSPAPTGQVPPVAPFTLEQRLQRMEAELANVRRVTDLHSARLRMAPATWASNVNNGGTDSPSSGGESDEPSNEISMKDPVIDTLARKCFDEFWTDFAPWAPYISPTTDTFDALSERSPLLLFCILAVTSRFQENIQFSQFAEDRALELMRGTLYTPDPPTLDDLKGTVVFNAWMSRGAPPGHSLSLAFQLDLPGKLEKLLESISLPPIEAAKVFEELMPFARTWLTLYAQDLWLSVATGRRSMVQVDFSINSARNLLTFTALRPVDARIIAQCELVNVLSGVQDVFLKTQKHSILDVVRIVMSAVDHLDLWMKSWSDWALLYSSERQESSTTAYMTSSFSMQLYADITTLGLRDVASPDEVTTAQLPVFKASIKAATDIQLAAVTYGPRRMSHTTEFTLISISSAALFLLKMIKLAPSAVPDIHLALSAVRNASLLLAGAPVKQYHRAVAGALQHLEATLDLVDAPTSGIDANALGAESMLFDPEMELAIASVLQSDDFWSWQQSLPADNFAGILS